LKSKRNKQIIIKIILFTIKGSMILILESLPKKRSRYILSSSSKLRMYKNKLNQYKSNKMIIKELTPKLLQIKRSFKVMCNKLIKKF